ncbi:polyprenyl synthetase family protein [Streptomyces sp. NBC_01443]|uniref:polyprenyl synthetase family protein n=1 Tax=Streptomyces sp. NBC_01443 TaxID=2903868 RepID=UPI0022596160|nr:polyprenyl synthetase family protein [Streptomyces sp. NBC_01443]MCX4633082.1 polyprenyl synthetase family protein [Streptomyces sp. NBC_01443]
MDTATLDLRDVRHAVDAVLEGFLAEKLDTGSVCHLPSEARQALHGFLFIGGKRLRPLLCVLGWHAAGGREELALVLHAAASLEMFHTFALIHDDVMDCSATRRGRPTLHRMLAELHHEGRSPAQAEHLGSSTAVLLGDLALAWSDELFPAARLTAAQLSAVLPIVGSMRTELMCGQYLDVVAAGQPTSDTERAMAIVHYKTAKYTVERPLHIGAALAGADPDVLASLSAFALPIGEAFQLRDDLLGVFGALGTTGKSCTEDLRDARHTVLLAHGLQRADDGQRQVLERLVGDPGLDEDGAARIRDILIATGARDSVERMITSRRDQALGLLDKASFPAAATDALRQIAHDTTTRDA